MKVRTFLYGLFYFIFNLFFLTLEQPKRQKHEEKN